MEYLKTETEAQGTVGLGWRCRTAAAEAGRTAVGMHGRSSEAMRRSDRIEEEQRCIVERHRQSRCCRHWHMGCNGMVCTAGSGLGSGAD